MTESETALSRFAHETQRWSKEHSISGGDEEPELPFPMYTVSWKVLRDMTEVRPFEELMYDDCLTVFKEQMGKAFFVSHQWLANNHPDPQGEQLKVLQEALSNIISGTSQVRIPLTLELLYGRVGTPKASDLKPRSLYIWYDYFSCPQGAGSKAVKQRQRAIDTIVTYVARCEYFVILCPELMHFDVGKMLGQESWAERGWCRTERLARELAAREDGFVILIESPMHQSLISNTRRHLDAPGKGFFTEETDRPRIAHVILQLVWRKLQYYLEQHDLPKYRFLLNTQEACCLANLGKAPLEGLVPDFRPTADPISDPQGCVVERFLHENGFCSITERDKAGWTPLCYATMSGSPFVVTSLLAQRANPNDKITKHKPDLLLPPKLGVLALAAHFRHGDVMQVLIEARADCMAVDGHYSVPLHWAASSDNVDGVKLLLDARASPEVANFPGLNLFKIACFCGSHKVVKHLLETYDSVDLKFSLHTVLTADGKSNECSQHSWMPKQT